MSNPTVNHPFRLPGADKPEDAFPSTVVDWKGNTPMLREVSMYWFVNSITDKPDWEAKVFDDAIVAKWKAEVAEFAARGGEEAAALEAAWRHNEPQVVLPPVARGFSDAMFDYCIAELKDKARIARESAGFVSVLDAAAAVVKSDRAVPPDVKAGLRALAARLEDTSSPDWHPGSDEQVLDLVHPSLWPLVYGKTRVLNEGAIGVDDALAAYASGTTIPMPTQSKAEGRLYSTKFQWLPAEVDVAIDGSVKFASYINNLHPAEYKAEYAVLERLLSAALPALDAVYTRALEWNLLPRALGRHLHSSEGVWARCRIECTESGRQCTTPDACDRWCYADNRPEDVDPPADGEDEWDANQRWFERTHPVTQPEPREYKYPGIESYRKQGGWFATPPPEWFQARLAAAEAAEKKEKLEKMRIERENAKAEREEAGENGEDKGDDNAKDEAKDADGDEDMDDDDDDSEFEVYETHEEMEAAEAAKAARKAAPNEDAVQAAQAALADKKWEELNKPDPAPITVPPAPLAPRRIQVIVKLANIHLTPEKPSYPGGSWHIEGQLNEAIVGTALYYYDSDNISESKLGFKSVCDVEEFSEGGFGYEQGDHEPFRMLFGARAGMSEDTTELRVGDVLTREDRLVVFPNVFRHRVAPFELADKSKAGHRKIVALFLVDPATPVISTANVPPQQLHWGGIPAVDQRLPAEIAQLVYDDIECPYSVAEAKRLRAELIEERKAIDVQVNEVISESEWCFCEH